MSDPKNISKPKVFLCYAQENHSLFEDFVVKFNNHNGDSFELIHDATPYSGNMHERFKVFAESCDIALLLVSPRFTLTSSYATEHELPILLDRQKRSDVAIIGLRFIDADFDEWNKNGDVYFFQAKYGELHSSASRHYKNAYAVYENVRLKDRNTFHKKLKKWVKEAYEVINGEKTSNNLIQEANDRKEDQIEIPNWEKMLNPIFYHLEKTLRDMEETYFSKNGFSMPSINITYVQSYFTQSKDALKKAEVGLRNCNPDGYQFISQVTDLYKKPMEICKQFKKLLLPIIPSNSKLNWALEEVCLQFEKVEDQLLSLNGGSNSFNKRQIKYESLIPLADAIDEISQELQKFIQDNLKPSQN